MLSLEELLAWGTQLQDQVERIYEDQPLPSAIASKIKSFQVQGNLILRKVDRPTREEFASLFARSRSELPQWESYNFFLKEQLDKAVGILMAVQGSGKESLDTTQVRVFISHGKFTPASTKLETFLRALACLPLYDSDEPTEGRTINQFVEKLFAESDFYTILATGETTNDRGERLPSHNVMIEFDRLVKTDQHRMIVLLEDGVKMPSMVQDVVRHGFTQECMDGAFTQLVRELNRNNLL